MFSPEEQQIEICSLKTSLKEIENDILVQRTALPTLDAENEKKCRETMSALRVVQSLNSEIERLKQENVRLTAKRMQLKQHCEDISRELGKARGSRSELMDLLKQEEDDTEREIRNYEHLLRDIAESFRKTRVFYNENQIKAEIESFSKSNMEFEIEEKKVKNAVMELQREFDQIESSVPEDLLDIFGKKELEEKLKAQSMENEILREKRDNLLNCRRTVPSYIFTRSLQ